MGKNGPRTNAKLSNEAAALAATARRLQKNVSYSRPFRQGVAATPSVAFGSKPVQKRNQKRARGVRGRSPRYFSALCPHHLPLPRAVGPYTVIRTTSKHTVDRNVSIWGPTTVIDPNGTEYWTNIVGVADETAGAPMNGGGNGYAYSDKSFGIFGAPESGWAQCTLVPAAFTLQIMNPAALATTASGGIAYIGKLKSLPKLANSTRHWDEFSDEFISYNYPRLCSGGKLALRGVTVSAVPYNMSDLSDFQPMFAYATGNFTWDGGPGESSLAQTGFAPIVISKDPGMNLQILVTVEWRVRFDPSNPAQAGHKLFKPSTDAQWAKHVAEETLRSTEDIAEFVADIGIDAAAIAAVGAIAV